MQQRMARAGWGFVLAWGMIGGCGGGTKTAPPSASNDDQALGGGGGGAFEARPEIPYFSCDKFGLKVVAPMDAESCPELQCDCLPVGTGWPVADGCLTSFDCAAVCDPASSEEWISCLYVYRQCAGDADCDASKRCFVPPDNDHGLCGTPQEDCILTEDCADGAFCVAVRDDGKRRCVAPSDRSPCNVDEHCPGGNCVLLDAGGVGLCSNGVLAASCGEDDDCQTGLVCGASACSDGKHESSCDSDDQCDSRSCRWETCVDGRDQDFCDRDGDCQSGICVYGIRCSDGNIDEMCEFDGDCSSGICAGDNGDSACTDGASGSKCLDDNDCISGACRYDVALRPGSHFGACN